LIQIRKPMFPPFFRIILYLIPKKIVQKMYITTKEQLLEIYQAKNLNLALQSERQFMLSLVNTMTTVMKIQLLSITAIFLLLIY